MSLEIPMILEHQLIAAQFVMQADLKVKNYERIHALHVRVDPNYKLLNKWRRETFRPVWGAIDSMLFYDIIDIIVESMREDETLREYFIDLYRPAFPEAENLLNDLRKNKTVKNYFSILNTKNDVLASYIIFMMGEDEEFAYAPHWLEPLDQKRIKHDIYVTEREFYSQEQFDNSEESIIDSPAFRTYLRRNRVKIAEYLDCIETDLSKTINGIIIEGLREEKKSENNGTPEMTARAERHLLMAHHNSGSSFFLGMCLETPSWIRSINYRPDVDRIIEIYYISKAITAYYATPEGEFNKLTLTRECITDNPKRDYEEILMLCNMDIIYKMYDYLTDLYYENFSWDRFMGKKSRELLVSNIKDLERRIEILIEKNEKQTNEINALKISINADKAEVARLYKEENDKLRDQIEELQKKNLRQHEIIEAQEELIEAIQKPVEETNEKVHLDKLQTYRYLFVGYFDTYLTEIKSLFPNSVFLTNANKDIAGVQVDFIVIATKYLSHSMFYKVKSSTIYTEVPNILCNSTSMDSFLAEMERGIEN